MEFGTVTKRNRDGIWFRMTIALDFQITPQVMPTKNNRYQRSAKLTCKYRVKRLGKCYGHKIQKYVNRSRYLRGPFYRLITKIEDRKHIIKTNISNISIYVCYEMNVYIVL